MLAANFDWQFIWDHLPDFWQGLKQTLKVAGIGIAGSLAIGIVLGAARAHRIPVVSWLAATYVEVIRNTPILVQIFFIAGALPHFPGHPIRLDPFTIAWLAVVVWGAGSCALRRGSSTRPQPDAASAAAMNARRFRYTRLSVISELRILAMEAHLGVHPHFNRHTVLHRRRESPLFEMTNGTFISVGVE